MNVKDGITYKVSGDGGEQFTAGVNVAREWMRTKMPQGAKFSWAISMKLNDATQAAQMESARKRTRDMFDGDGKGDKPRRGPKAAKPVRVIEDKRPAE